MAESPELILVADKPKLLELVEKSQIKVDKITWLAFTALLLKETTSLFAAPVVAAAVVASVFKNSEKKQKSDFAKDEILKKIQNELGLSSEIFCVDPKDAHQLKLNIGDKPTNGSFYIKHPLLDDIYIRPSDYESTLAREKEAAFRRLSSSLGAKRITLRDAQFFDKKGNISSDVKLPKTVCTNIGINAQFDQKGAIIREVYSEFGTPRKLPYIPEELSGWTRIDPDLRTMAHDRLEGHLLKHQVNLRFAESMSGGGKIAAEIANKGLDIGGSISKNVSSVWSFEVEYYPITENI